MHDDRVEVDLGDAFGVVRGKVRQLHHQGRKRVDIGRRRAAELGEQPRALQLTDERTGRVVIERHRGERGVGERFDQHAAQPHHQKRPPTRVAIDAEDDLAAGPRHRLNQHPVDVRGRRMPPRRGDHALVGGAYIAAGDIERHAAGFGLVGDVGGLDLQRDRPSDLQGGGFRLGRRLRQYGAVVVADAVSGEQGARLPFADDRARGGQCRASLLARIARRRRGRRPGGQLFAPFLVIEQSAHRARRAERAGEQCVSGLVQDLDAALGGQRIGPHEDRLARVALEVLQLLKVALEEGRAARRDDDDDAVDQRRLRGDAGKGGVAHLVHALRGRIDRVFRRAIGRNVLFERTPRRIVEHGYVEPGGGAGVRRPDAAAARGRHDAHAVARGQAVLAAGEEADGEVEHLVEVAALDQAVMVEDGAVGGLRAGERGRVRGDRANARLRLADLADDQRLAGLQGLFGGAPEFLRRLHVLDQKQEDVAAALVDEIIEHVGDIERRFVAGGDDMPEEDVARPRAIEEGEAQTAALRDHRHLAAADRLCRADRAGVLVERRREGRAQRSGNVGVALRIRAGHRHVVAARDRRNLRLHARAFAARFLGKARRHDDGRLDAGLAAALELGHDMHGRDDQHRHVDGFRQRVDGRIGLVPLHLGGAAADRIDAALVRMAEKRLEDAAAQAVQVRGRADHRHRFRPQQLFEIGQDGLSG